MLQGYLSCLKLTWAALSPSVKNCRVCDLVLASAVPVLTAVTGIAALVLKFRDLDTYGAYIPKLD